MSGLVGNPFLLTSAGGATGYQIERSLRFNSSDSAYLSRTPASAGNRKTWTWAGWVKRGQLGGSQGIFTSGTSNPNLNPIYFGYHSADTVAVLYYNGSFQYLVETASVFRDPSAWYHVLIAYDSTQATPSDRIRIFVNGVKQANFISASYPAQNLDGWINAVDTHAIGAAYATPSVIYSGLLADVFFIDGQALDPSAFVETSATTGQLIPKAYTGTFGTNGFWLKFSDNSAATATTLGKDYSGNGNNWTPNNLSVTAGAGNDSLVDTPTSYGTDTGAGGEVRGNYATLNPLSKQANCTLSNGNLDWSTSSNTDLIALSTFGMRGGKWYCEFTPTAGANNMLGLQNSGAIASIYLGGNANSWGYYQSNGYKYNNGSPTSYGATYTIGDVIGVAFDADNGTLTFYKNGVGQGTAYSGLSTSDTYFFALGNGGGSFATTFNAGARPFAYTAPSGFKALCDTNLPAPVVAKSDQFFQTVLWTGNNTNNRAITGLNFSPDFIWIKNRTNASENSLFDAVRGAAKTLYSNQTAAELSSSAYGHVSSFDSAGFTLANGSDANYPNLATNYLNSNIVGWCWDAGSSTVTNTQGSITSQVRANASSGFSVVTYTGTGANATVGHGLGIAPGLVLVKRRNSTSNWQVRHTSIAAANSIQLNLISAAASATTVWNSTAPTSTVFSIGTDASVNASGGTYVAYCFAPVAGYSAMSSFLGNANADGPFQWCGFRPKLIIAKVAGATGGRWAIFDSARIGYNGGNNSLTAEDPSAENSSFLPTDIDILSNGFKIRHAARLNASGEQVIWAAWAESPFQYARAR